MDKYDIILFLLICLSIALLIMNICLKVIMDRKYSFIQAYVDARFMQKFGKRLQATIDTQYSYCGIPYYIVVGEDHYQYRCTLVLFPQEKIKGIYVTIAIGGF